MDLKEPIPGLAGPLEVRTETAEDGSRRICLGGAVDLPARERLGFCSSTGLEALVRLHQRGQEAGVPVRIRPTAQLRRLMDLTGLTGILDLAP